MIQKNLLVSVCDVSPHWLSTITFLHPHFEKTRTKYSQIRKYEITFIFGVQIFYEYIFGKSFKIITDHNPLSANPTKWSNTLKQFVGRSDELYECV